MSRPFGGIFSGRRVLVTGHTGFKGSWLSLWLSALGARVAGLALPPSTSPSNYAASAVAGGLDREAIVDLRQGGDVAALVESFRPEVVFHLAAQALVRQSYAEPVATFATNVLGTVHLLEAIRTSGCRCVVVVVTSDKCYAPDAQGRRLREPDPLGGRDCYSASKAAAELACAAYRDSFFPPERAAAHGVKLATVRAGNVIGGGDWAQDRLVPDIVRALAAGQVPRLRNPRSVRPWQHVLEPLSGYLLLAARMLGSDDPELCSAWNFGPPSRGERTVGDVTAAFLDLWGGGSFEEAPAPGAPPETGVLRLSSEKAQSLLGWAPRWTLEAALRRTAEWYRRFYSGEGHPMREDCLRQIAEYEASPALEPGGPEGA
jgi:CDP-glucose 4,6-dehydratase